MAVLADVREGAGRRGGVVGLVLESGHLPFQRIYTLP
jgi:hypothetical protein